MISVAISDTSPVFAAGDCVTGPATVIGAVAAGQRAAVNIDKLLGGAGKLPPDTAITFTKPNEDELMANTERPTQKCAPADRRKANFDEVVFGLDKEKAVQEAKRCLRCDLEE